MNWFTGLKSAATSDDEDSVATISEKGTPNDTGKASFVPIQTPPSNSSAVTPSIVGQHQLVNNSSDFAQDILNDVVMAKDTEFKHPQNPTPSTSAAVR